MYLHWGLQQCLGFVAVTDYFKKQLPVLLKPTTNLQQSEPWDIQGMAEQKTGYPGMANQIELVHGYGSWKQVNGQANLEENDSA